MSYKSAYTGAQIDAGIAAAGTALQSVPDGAVTPAKCSTGHPTWDTSGNVTITGSLTEGSLKQAQTSSISVTTATTIATIDQPGGGNCGALTLVSGVKSGNGSIAFIDVVLWMYGGGAPTVISSQTQGSPATRTYTVSASANLQLAMSANTYIVGTTTFRQAYA